MIAPGYRACPLCPPEDNEWPAEEFTTDPMGGACTACYVERKRARRPCSTPRCTAVVETFLGVAEPRCMRCRRRRKSIAGARAAQAAKRREHAPAPATLNRAA